MSHHIVNIIQKEGGVPKASLSLETDTTLMDAIKTTLFIEYAKDVCTLPHVKIVKLMQ